MSRELLVTAVCGLLIEVGCSGKCPQPEPCVCPTSTVSAAPTTSGTVVPTTTTSVKPKAPGRSTQLPEKLSKKEKKAAIANEDDPVKVEATVEKQKGLSGVTLELNNTTDKTVVAFKGYVYGFNKMDEPMEIALGGEFVKFLSADDTKLTPGKSKQWYRSYYGLAKGTTALVEIVKVKYDDGSDWER